MDQDATFQRRVERIRQEIGDEIEVELPSAALEELAFCRFIAPHEGRRPSYGAVVWRTDLPARFAGVPPSPSTAGFYTSGAPLNLLRSFADGRTSFVIRGPGIVPGLSIDPDWVGTEDALAAHARSMNVIIIQRLMSSRIRLFLDDQVFSEEEGVWLSRSAAVAYFESLAHLVDSEHEATARAIVSVCVHNLSPAGHGAILVWFPNGLTDDTSHLDLSVKMVPPSLSAGNSSHAPAIAHALGQLDRAVLLDTDGRLAYLNVTLLHAESERESTYDGGTRHNSAGRYSASQPDAIVFVVSADGPLTIFHKGRPIASSSFSLRRKGDETASL